jgi:hypothetical protein
LYIVKQKQNTHMKKFIAIALTLLVVSLSEVSANNVEITTNNTCLSHTKIKVYKAKKSKLFKKKKLACPAYN